MIENMRKYTGLMIVVLVLLAAGLILTMGNFKPTTAGGGKVTSAYGEDIDSSTFKKMGYNTLRVIKKTQDLNLLMYAGDNGAIYIAPFHRQILAQQPALSSIVIRDLVNQSVSTRQALNFVTNRIVIKKEAERLGIYASEKKAVEYIQNTMFSTEGKFDKAAYDEFIKSIGQTGYSKEDFVKLVGEFQVYNKLTSTLLNGIQSSRKESEKFALFELQTIDATAIELNIEDFKKDIKPTDEQIKEYWTLNEGAYQTKRQLKLSYILVKPYFDKPEPIAPIRPEGMSDEDFAKLEAPYQKALATWSNERKTAVNTLAGMVDDFSLEIEQDGGEKFVELSKENGFAPVTTELFDIESAPKEIKDLKTHKGQSVLTSLFKEKFGTSKKHQVKDPIKTENDGWFYCRFTEEKPSTPKTFEAAKEQATKDYIEKEAKAAMAKAAEDLKTKLAAEIKAGKSLEDAAKALNLKTEKITSITAPTRESSSKEIQIFQHASTADPKSFTKENVDLGDTLSILFLDKRVVYSDPATQMRISQAANQNSARLSQQIFQSYMSEATKKAEIEMPKIEE